jgi:hypothetical protein
MKELRASKLYTVLSKPGHRRKKSDIRLIYSCLSSFLQDGLNQAKMTNLDADAMRLICRKVSVGRYETVDKKENDGLLFQDNQPAERLFIVLKGEICIRKKSVDSDLPFMLDKLLAALFSTNQTVSVMKYYLDEFLELFKTTLCFPFEAGDETFGKWDRFMKPGDLLSAECMKFSKEWEARKDRIDLWAKYVTKVLQNKKSLGPMRKEKTAEFVCEEAIKLLTQLDSTAVGLLIFRKTQIKVRQRLPLTDQRLPKAKLVEEKLWEIYNFLSHVEEDIYQISHLVTPPEFLSSLQSWTHCDERINLLPCILGNCLKSEEVARRFGVEETRIRAWDGFAVLGAATFRSNGARYENTAVVCGSSSAVCAIVNKSDILPILKTGFLKDMKEKTKFIRGIDVFKNWSTSKLVEMVYRMENEVFLRNSKVISRGTEAKSVHIVYQGWVSVVTPLQQACNSTDVILRGINDGYSGQIWCECGPGTILGESAVLKGAKLHGLTEIIALSSSVVTLKLSRNIFEDLILSSPSTFKSLQSLKAERTFKRKQWRNAQKYINYQFGKHPKPLQSTYTSMHYAKDHRIREKMKEIKNNLPVRKKSKEEEINFADGGPHPLQIGVKPFKPLGYDEGTQKSKLARSMLSCEQDILLAIKEDSNKEYIENKVDGDDKVARIQRRPRQGKTNTSKTELRLVNISALKLPRVAILERARLVLIASRNSRNSTQIYLEQTKEKDVLANGQLSYSVPQLV